MKRKKYRIIDCHQHVNFCGYGADELVRHMDDIGVKKAWVLSWESIDGSFEPCYSHLSVGDVWHAYSKYPDRFVPVRERGQDFETVRILQGLSCSVVRAYT